LLSKINWVGVFQARLISTGSAKASVHELEAKTLDEAKAEADIKLVANPGASLHIEQDGYPEGWENVALKVNRPSKGETQGWQIRMGIPFRRAGRDQDRNQE